MKTIIFTAITAYTIMASSCVLPPQHPNTHHNSLGVSHIRVTRDIEQPETTASKINANDNANKRDAWLSYAFRHSRKGFHHEERDVEDDDIEGDDIGINVKEGGTI